MLNIAAVGIMAAWATIVACQLRLYRHTKTGLMQRPRFRMPLAPTAAISPWLFWRVCWC
ncbi:L-asparagine permease 2 domain protein [Mycobacterium xenopi 3993]|nr:L-asparagine permease 2 domain protein [Mycobacterium xenopi 3993]